MLSLSWIILVLDLASDDPGIEYAFGPFQTYESASFVADDYARRHNLARGVDVQVTQLASVESFGYTA